MTAPTRTQAENALAALVHAIRPDWDTPGILAVIRSKPTAPLAQIAAAAIKATTRHDRHSPHLIADDDGTALDMLLGRINIEPTPQPPRRLTCPTHGEHDGSSCPRCRAAAAPAARAAGYIAQARQAIIDARPNHTDEQETR